MLCTRPQNGITLIALIITVIVMLILVGVTINVALNGGLFTQAQEASKNTQIQADKEQLLSAIVASYDIETGTIKSKSELEKNLGDGWTVEEEGSVYKVTSPKGNVFTVKTDGTIIDGNENGGETGETEQPTEGTDGKEENTEENYLGKYVTYKEIVWIVLYDDKENDKIELISANGLGSVTLGDVAFDGGKEAYNNAIETLTEECKKVTRITTEIRNVGGPAEDPGDLGTVTLEEIESKRFKPKSDYEEVIEGLISNIKQEDENYEDDYYQMKKLGILITDDSSPYWLASRQFSIASQSFSGLVRFINSKGESVASTLFYISNVGTTLGNSNIYSHPVRPVVTLGRESLRSKPGLGTAADPINLDIIS